MVNRAEEQVTSKAGPAVKPEWCLTRGGRKWLRNSEERSGEEPRAQKREKERERVPPAVQAMSGVVTPRERQK